MILNDFKWSAVRYLNLANHHPARITKSDKDLVKNIKFPVKIRDIHKIEKYNSNHNSNFGYQNNEKYPIYVSKRYYKENHVDFLLIGEGEKNAVFIKYFNIFMYDLSLHSGRKHFCRCCLHAVIREEILKRHIKDCFNINRKQIM